MILQSYTIIVGYMYILYIPLYPIISHYDIYIYPIIGYFIYTYVYIYIPVQEYIYIYTFYYSFCI
jgi:hypothetical protein